MTKIVGIAGSLRKASINGYLLRAAASLVPQGTELELASIAGIPLFNQDELDRGMPAAVAELKERVAQADGLLLATPEYNHSLPGVLKNAVDWLSRPASDIPRLFGDKPVALMGAATGAGGTRLAQAAWLPVLRVLGTRPYFGKSMFVVNGGKVFDPDGNLTDESTRQHLSEFIAGFAHFIAKKA